MLKATIENTDNTMKVSVNASGSVAELAEDIARLMNALYTQIRAGDEEDAEKFRYFLSRLTDDDSPVWIPTSPDTGLSIITPKED